VADSECKLLPVQKFLRSLFVVERNRGGIREDGSSRGTCLDVNIDASLEETLCIKTAVGRLPVYEADGDKKFIGALRLRPCEEFKPHIEACQIITNEIT
jgi:hypothetical protein